VLLAENLASVESEGRRLLTAARRDPERAVPQYPGWTLADLLNHTATIHARTVKVVTELPTERVSAPRLPEGADVLEWYEQTLESMLAALTDADPNARCWGFVPDANVGSWETRMVIETGVHRWDAYQAFGEEDRLTDLVAVSGLDEFGGMWFPRLGDLPTLEAIDPDLGRSWVFGEGEPEVSVQASASDLYLRLMSRPSPVELPSDWAGAVDGLAPPPKR
jgi:uncharacterized protein (TIGR03083 family)